jgi:hypothetical protein
MLKFSHQAEKPFFENLGWNGGADAFADQKILN